MASSAAERILVNVRPGRVRDAERIAVLMTQLGYAVAVSDLADRLRRRPKRREIFVATSAGAMLGWVSVSSDESFVTGFTALIEGFVVDEGTRSRGIGARLLEAAEAWARKRGCGEIHVRSNVIRERAHAFYERNAFVKAKAQYLLKKPL
jgi:GNAT superfamily N-acetyltransferase